MEQHSTKDDARKSALQQRDPHSTTTLDPKNVQEPASTSVAHHGRGPVGSSTELVQPIKHAAGSATTDATEAYQQVGLLRAELAAVKESLASYESTLQQLLSVPSAPEALQHLQRTGAAEASILNSQQQRLVTAPLGASMQPFDDQQWQASSREAEGGLHLQPPPEHRPQTSVPSPQEHDAVASVVLDQQVSQGTSAPKQCVSQEHARMEAALGRSSSPVLNPGSVVQDLFLQSQPLFATSAVVPDTRLQASASAPSFGDEQLVASSSIQQTGGSATVVQRRSTVGPIDSTPAGGYDFLQASMGLSTFSGLRPPSPYQVPLSPPVSVGRHQQYRDASGSHNLTPTGQLNALGLHAAGTRLSSPGAGTAYSTSPSMSGSVLSPHYGHSAAAGLLPPLPGKQSRYSDPTTPAAVAAAVVGVASSPGSGFLARGPVGSSIPGTGPAQGLPAGWSQLSSMHPDTVGSLNLSPPEVAAGGGIAGGGVRGAAFLPLEAPDVLPSSSSTAVDQFAGQQKQAVALQHQQWHQGGDQEAPVRAEQLLMQEYSENLQQQQQHLVAALSQLGIQDPSMASMMTVPALLSATGSPGGMAGSGAAHDPVLEAQAAAALAASASLGSSSNLALQQHAMQAQTLANLQAQAELHALQQAQLLQLLQQQQQYNPFLQQMLAAQAATVGGMRQPLGPLSPWASHTESSASSSSSGRRSSRGGDAHPSGRRDVRKAAGDRTGRALAAGEVAASGRQQRSSSGSPDWRRVFVGNIGWWVDEQMLQRVFAEYGTITDAQVMWNTKLLAKGKRVNREFAFISFTTPEEAGNAIHWLNGRFIEGITKDRDGLTVQYEAQGVGKATGRGHDPPLHLQEIVRFGLTGQQQQQQVILQQLQQQNALDLLTHQQQQPWQHASNLALLQQLGGSGMPQQAGSEDIGLGALHETGSGSGTAVGPSGLQRPVGREASGGS